MVFTTGDPYHRPGDGLGDGYTDYFNLDHGPARAGGADPLGDDDDIVFEPLDDGDPDPDPGDDGVDGPLLPLTLDPLDDDGDTPRDS